MSKTAARKKQMKPKLEDAAMRLLSLSLSVIGVIPGHLMWMQDDKLVNAQAEFEVCVRNLAEALDIKLVDFNDKGCHWHPVKGDHRRAQAGDEHNRDVSATVCVGQERMPLCESCSQLRSWSRCRIREAIPA